MSPSFSGVNIRPVIAVEHGNAESETGVRTESRVEELHAEAEGGTRVVPRPGAVVLAPDGEPSTAKQMVPVTNTECSQSLYMAFWMSALDGCITCHAL
jgi:hypothetical protein